FPAPDTMARPPLAVDVVRFVGDMIAVVVASTQAEAIDAAGAVVVDYDPLVAVVDVVSALEPGAVVGHTAEGDILAFPVEIGEAGAREGAEVIVRGRFVNQRLAGVPIETNVAIA